MYYIPGSRKTELFKKLIRNAKLNIARIDMDEIISNMMGYISEQADKLA